MLFAGTCSREGVHVQKIMCMRVCINEREKRVGVGVDMIKYSAGFMGVYSILLSSLGICTQIWILWEPPLDQPNDYLSAISKPSAFLSRKTLCSAKRGQVQLCLIALFHAHTRTQTQRSAVHCG